LALVHWYLLEKKNNETSADADPERELERGEPADRNADEDQTVVPITELAWSMAGPCRPLK